MPNDSRAATVTLDGRSFHGVVLDAGKTQGDAETIRFSGGRFRSSACDAYGYGDGAYTAHRDGEVIRFEAETESPTYGRLQWRGAINGPRLDGTLTMIRDGANVLELRALWTWIETQSSPAATLPSSPPMLLLKMRVVPTCTAPRPVVPESAVTSAPTLSWKLAAVPVPAAPAAGAASSIEASTTVTTRIPGSSRALARA